MLSVPVVYCPGGRAKRPGCPVVGDDSKRRLTKSIRPAGRGLSPSWVVIRALGAPPSDLGDRDVPVAPRMCPPTIGGRRQNSERCIGDLIHEREHATLPRFGPGGRR